MRECVSVSVRAYVCVCVNEQTTQFVCMFPVSICISIHYLVLQTNTPSSVANRNTLHSTSYDQTIVHSTRPEAQALHYLRPLLCEHTVKYYTGGQNLRELCISLSL